MNLCVSLINLAKECKENGFILITLYIFHYPTPSLILQPHSHLLITCGIIEQLYIVIFSYDIKMLKKVLSSAQMPTIIKESYVKLILFKLVFVCICIYAMIKRVLYFHAFVFPECSGICLKQPNGV